MIENNIPDDSLFDYIARELKPKYKIGLLSNAADNWLDELFSPPQVALFDAVALSYHVGYIKPEPEIYLEIARQLAVDPSECLFIDDNLRYCVGARQVGMTAIHHRGSGDLSHQINQALD
jgi:HAD superfamily hydrolase (TIGR01509 family)